MNKILAMIFILTLSVGLQILVMIYGWGLQPKSWFWILGIGYFAEGIVRAIASKVVKEKA